MFTLIEKYLPQYDYTEVHKLTIAATPKACYEQTLQLNLSKSSIVKFLFRLRGLPFKEHTLQSFAKKMKFTLLEESPYTEFIYGFWTKKGIERIDDKDKFIHNGQNYKTKVAWHFLFTKVSNDFCEVRTETRVKCLTRRAGIIFSAYWFFIKPFSGIIRMKMLKQLQKNLSHKHN